MTKLRIFLLVFGSLFVNLLILLGLPSIGNGCAVPPDYFEGYVTFFNSNLAHDSLFAKYYYDMANNRSDYQIDEAVGESQTTANLREWQQYFGPEIAADQIADLVYKRPPAELEKVQKEVLKGGGAVGAATGNKALDWIARPERLPALDYLIYAKQCEPYVIVTSPWDVEQEIKERRKPAEMLKLMEVGLGKYQLAQTSFLRLRYGYQIVRLAHYAGKPQDCLKYYQQLVAPLGSQSIIAAWAARLQNGALLKIGRQAQALVATSLMFDQNPLMMDEAYTDFTIPPDPVWEECLRLAGIPHRQATLWMLRGLQEKRIMLLPVQKMYALEPGSSRLEVMLIRHVNQIERLHFSSALFLGDDRPVMTANQRFALKYIRELAAFIKTVDLQKVHQPALWGAVAGYLSMAEKRHEQAAQYLTTAAAEAVVSKTRNPDLARQIELLQCLNEITAGPAPTEPLERSCLSTLQWLDQAGAAKSNLENIRESFYTFLARKYLAAGDLPKGYCCLAKADIGTEALLKRCAAPDFDRLIAFLAKTGKTPFESSIAAHPKYGPDDLYSFKGTLLLRQHNYREALANFQKITPAHWEKIKKDTWSEDGEYGEMRTSFEKSCYNVRTGLYNYPPHGFQHFTKLDFTRKVMDLLETARLHPDKADRCYYQIANGFFHTPFWADDENLQGSRYWEELDSYSDNADDSGNAGESANTSAFFGVMPTAQPTAEPGNDLTKKRTLALAYYLKAMQITKDPELAAACCFLAQACKTEFSYYAAFEEPGKDHHYYFDQLYKKYRQTAYYRDVLRECATLQDYVAKAEGHRKLP